MQGCVEQNGRLVPRIHDSNTSVCAFELVASPGRSVNYLWTRWSCNDDDPAGSVCRAFAADVGRLVTQIIPGPSKPAVNFYQYICEGAYIQRVYQVHVCLLLQFVKLKPCSSHNDNDGIYLFCSLNKGALFET